MAKEAKKIIANNKKARHDYFIEETYEAGISLAGTEVKSLRMGKCSIKEAFVRVEKGEVYIYGMHISPYEKGNIFNKDPLRVKKLLLHKYEINKMIGQMKQKGYTLVPLNVYFKGSYVKVEVGLARGKKLYDKRQDIAKKDQQREAEKQFKRNMRFQLNFQNLKLTFKKKCDNIKFTESEKVIQNHTTWGCNGFDGDFETRAAIRGSGTT